MSQSGVFICPSCQNVVRSEENSTEGLVCPECQHEFSSSGPAKGKSLELPGAMQSKGGGVVRNLTAKKAPIVSVPGTRTEAPIEAKSYEDAVVEGGGSRRSASDEEMIMPDGTRKVKRRKKRENKEKNKPMILFLVGWVCVVVIIFALFKTGKKSGNGQGGDDEKVDITATRDRIFLKKHQETIEALFKSYILSPTSEGREQYIDRSAELARSYSHFYRTHSFFQPKAPIYPLGFKVIDVSEEPRILAVESVWVDSNQRRFGAVHYYDGTGWKLDWEAFAPYSTNSWARFRLS